jgi:hypothetical protein
MSTSPTRGDVLEAGICTNSAEWEAKPGSDPLGDRAQTRMHRDYGLVELSFEEDKARASKHAFLRDIGVDECIDYIAGDFSEALADIDTVIDPIIPIRHCLAPSSRSVDACHTATDEDLARSRKGRAVRISVDTSGPPHATGVIARICQRRWTG